MKETIHFRYKSPENFVRLLCEVVYEQKHSPRDIAIYHERFDNETDEFFANMLKMLFPEGGAIGEKEIHRCVAWIDDFLLYDEQTKDIEVKYDMAEYDSYVYFDIDKKVYPCSYTSHQQTVKEICVDYFKGFDKSDLSAEKVADFIKKHFIVKSQFSTAETIARDSQYIMDCIVFDDEDWIKERRANDE